MDIIESFICPKKEKKPYLKSIKDTKQKEVFFILLYFHFRKSPLPEGG